MSGPATQSGAAEHPGAFEEGQGSPRGPSPEIAAPQPATAPAEVRATPATAETPKGRSTGSEILYFALRNTKLLVGISIVAIFLVFALVGPLLVRHPPNSYSGPPAVAPSGTFWLGTTYFGQDVFSQFVYGLRASFLVGLLGGGFATVIGMAIGFTPATAAGGSTSC